MEKSDQNPGGEGREFTQPNPAEVEKDTYVVEVGAPHSEWNPEEEMRTYIEQGKDTPIEFVRDPELMRKSLVSVDTHEVKFGNMLLEWMGSPTEIPDAEIGERELTDQEYETISSYIRGLTQDELSNLIQKSLEDGLKVIAGGLTREYQHPEDMPEKVRASLKRLQEAVHPPRNGN